MGNPQWWLFSEKLFFEKLRYEDNYLLLESTQEEIEKLCQEYIENDNPQVLQLMMDKVLENYSLILSWIKPVYTDIKEELHILDNSLM